MRISLLCLLLIGCSGSITNKNEPDEEPIVGGAADSLRTPQQKGDLWAGGQTANDFSANSRYHSFNLPLTAGQAVNLRLGGVASDGSILDTVLYVYGPADAKGKRTQLLRNDDRTLSDVGSKLHFVAPADGSYLVVTTTYYKPDAGHYVLTVGCPDGPCAVPVPPTDPKPSPKFDIAPFANPEVLAYFQLHFGENADATAAWPNAHVDGLTALLGADAVEDGATGAIAASDGAYLSQSLFAAGDALTDAQKKKLQAALDGYLGTPAHFARLSAHAQEICLMAQSWDAGTAPDPAALKGVVDALQQSWPGSTVESTEVMPQSHGGKLYGFNVSVTLALKDASGAITAVWEGLESFGPTGTYLGDFSLSSHPPGQG
jgi:hypothetical protein